MSQEIGCEIGMGAMVIYCRRSSTCVYLNHLWGHRHTLALTHSSILNSYILKARELDDNVRNVIWAASYMEHFCALSRFCLHKCCSCGRDKHISVDLVRQFSIRISSYTHTQCIFFFCGISQCSKSFWSGMNMFQKYTGVERCKKGFHIWL